MAKKFLSPGVFTQEIDQSYLEQGVAGIGAVVIGRSKKGPAMTPVRVSSFDEFYERFGDVDVNMQATYAARNYLKNSTALSFVRVLGHADGNSDVTPGYSVGGILGIADGVGAGAQVLAVVHTGSADAPTVVGVAGSTTNFVVTFGSYAVTASFLSSSANYIEKVLNTDPTRYSTDGHYLYRIFKYATSAASASWCAVEVSGGLTEFEDAFTSGSTPWVKSQPLGNKEFNLFRFHTVGHGRSTNDEVKVTIRNIKPSVNSKATPYGSFDVVVRKFYDTDLRQETLQTFANVNMNPNDKNYIARRIGTMYDEFDTNERKFVTFGDFPSNSSYIRVEMMDNSGAPPEALPWGHAGYSKMKFNATNLDGDGSAYTVPALTYQGNQVDVNSNWNENVHWGVQFVSGGVVDRMRAFVKFSGSQRADNLTADADFSLKYLSGTYEGGKLRYHYDTTETYAPIYTSGSIQKFTMPFQGGFDGFDLRTENPLYISNDAADSTIGVSSLKRAIDCVADPDYIDINLLAIPGIHNLKVTDHARTMVNERTDAMYIMDITGSTVSEAIDQMRARDLDDNYTAVYYPDVKIDDRVNNRIVRVAPSVAVLGAYAYSDRVGHQWFAPAGLNRAGLAQFDVISIVDRVNFSDRDSLSDNRINPIASFPNEGIVVWGQKTLQVAASALDRVNIRRLLIYAKKTIASAAKYLVFEPNDPSTYQKFANTVNPILDRVRQDRGLERFKVVMDSSVNTPDVVDRNTIVGKIFLQPIRSAEYIDLQFIITNAGVQFSA